MRELKFQFFAINFIIVFIVILFKNNYYVCLIIHVAHLASLFFIGEKGIYPFDGQQKVRNKISYYGSVLIAVTIANYLRTFPVQTWYPTSNTAWMYTFIVIYGFVMRVRGFRHVP